MSHQRQAEDLLVHYFRLVFEKAGLRFDSDSEMEIRSIVQSILIAAIEPQ